MQIFRLNPFEVREVSKRWRFAAFKSKTKVLIPLKSGKFLNENLWLFKVEAYVLIPLKSGKFLNFATHVQKCSTLVLIPLKSGKFLNLEQQGQRMVPGLS